MGRSKQVGLAPSRMLSSQKLNSDGSTIEFSTYLGGSFGDWSDGIALDSENNVYIAGGTGSPGFPVTSGAFQTSLNGTPNINGDAFVAKLSSDGSQLLYSTFVGGSGGESARAVAVDGLRQCIHHRHHYII